MNGNRDKPLHQVRHVPPPPRHKAERADPNYSPGYFSELVRLHHFPPMFSPTLGRPVEAWRSELARASRERRVEQGHAGSINGLSDRADVLISQMRARRLNGVAP